MKELKKKSIENNFQIGIKLVRGAYIEKENRRAKKYNYKSPICESKHATDTNFNEGANFILSNLDNFSLFCGSHNEKSIYNILDIMRESKMQNNNPKIWFGQLYGMSDNISFNLAEEGYNVIKYLPFGPIKELILDSDNEVLFNQDELIDIINNGRVIFNKSEPKNKPCGVYFIKSGDLNLNIINCENEATVKIN